MGRRCQRNVVLHTDRDGHFLNGAVRFRDTQAQDIVTVGDGERIPGGERGILRGLREGLEGEPGIGWVRGVPEIQLGGLEVRVVHPASDGDCPAKQVPGQRRSNRHRRGGLCGDEEQNQG